MKLKDFEFLKSLTYSGPFSSTKKVRIDIKFKGIEEEKHQDVAKNSLCKNDKSIVKISRISA